MFKHAHLTVLLILISTSSLNAQALSDSLIAHYAFDGDASTTNAANLNGVLYGPVATADQTLTANAALLFDGINDYIEVAGNVANVVGLAFLYQQEVKPDERTLSEADPR